jgi:glycosyltransferase involved in cell wall biosynthesis
VSESASFAGKNGAAGSGATPRPKVSIGLAVFNGEPYLRESIESLLAQTFQDFELIISDNASTDRTADISQEYARLDPRIRYYRNPVNIGGANNENRTFELARGIYFRWAAHDDVCAPHLLEKCVAVLDANPSVVLCYTEVIEIDERGNRGRMISRNNGASSKPYTRFATIANSADFCEETYGLIRSDVLRRTRLQQNYTASDRTLLCELSLYGLFYEVPEPLFYKRFHPKNVYSDWRARMAWFNPALEGKITFPFWTQFFDYLETIRRVPSDPYVKLRCYLAMGRWLKKFGPKMGKDVLVAMYMGVHSDEWRKARHARANNWS